MEVGVDHVGALSIPREVKMVSGKITTFPVREAESLLEPTDEMVKISGDSVSIPTEKTKYTLQYNGCVDRVSILKDTKTVEVFINGGEASFTYCFAK